MNLVTAFSAAVQAQPQKVALFWGEREYPYQELWQRSLAVSEQMQQRFGLKQGDRVGIWLKNCPHFILALFGILQAGAIVVPINNFLKPGEVSFILEDAGIDLLISDQELGVHFSA